MARIRTIKPDFFFDEKIAELDHKSRLAFIGLWCESDREGRFEWRTKKLKATLFPYDNLNLEKILDRLKELGFIKHYRINDKEYGCIPTFLNHQIPNRNEAPSNIPAPDGRISDFIPHPSNKIRQHIYERDNFHCVYCGLNMIEETRKRCLDHIYPISKIGTNHVRNLVTSCKKCNAIKAARTPEEAYMKWPLDEDGVKLGHTVNDMDVEEDINPPLTVENIGLTGAAHGKEGERKGKEGKGKGKESDPPVSFKASDSLKEWCIENNLSSAKLKELAEACFDYFRSKGVKRIDWEATLRNWIRKDKQFNPTSNEPEYKQL